jgi:hypothetical protein
MQTLAELSHDLAELGRVRLDDLPGLFQAGGLGFLSIGCLNRIGHRPERLVKRTAGV